MSREAMHKLLSILSDSNERLQFTAGGPRPTHDALRRFSCHLFKKAEVTPRLPPQELGVLSVVLNSFRSTIDAYPTCRKWQIE